MEGKKAGARAAKQANAAKQSRQPKGNGGGRRPIYLAAAAVVVIALFAYLFYSLSAPVSFQTFQHNFNSAASVAIYVNDTNSSTYTYAAGCADALVQELAGPTAAHRNASTIHFFIIYNASTECVYNPGQMGQPAGNYTYTSASNCLNYSKAMPSVFFRYAAANGTTVTATKLYVAGNAKFMALCGIAYQIV